LDKLQINHYLMRKRQIFRIGTVHYAEGLWCMCRHGPVIVHCTDSEDFPRKLFKLIN